MATFIMTLAGFLGALSNLCMRKSIDNKGTAKAFFVFQLTCSALVIYFLDPLKQWSWVFAFLGFLGGISLGMMKMMLDKALQIGSSSLTFAAVNCASVIPGVFTAILFSTLLNPVSYLANFAGSLLVLVGLFWAGWGEKGGTEPKWPLFVALAFFFHLLFLILTETHGFLYQRDTVFYSSCHECFGITLFAVAAGMHTIIFAMTEKRFPTVVEFSWGFLGGFCNGICAFLFFYSTTVATTREYLYIFPLFSIALITFCNVWGQWLYKEVVNWRATLLCLVGLLIGS